MSEQTKKPSERLKPLDDRYREIYMPTPSWLEISTEIRAILNEHHDRLTALESSVSRITGKAEDADEWPKWTIVKNVVSRYPSTHGASEYWTIDEGRHEKDHNPFNYGWLPDERECTHREAAAICPAILKDYPLDGCRCPSCRKESSCQTGTSSSKSSSFVPASSASAIKSESGTTGKTEPPKPDAKPTESWPLSGETGAIAWPINVMSGAEWNILDSTGTRIAWCGYDEALKGGDNTKGKRIAWAIVGMIGNLKADKEGLQEALRREERQHLQTVGERDALSEQLDAVVEAVGGSDVCGEHSNLNDPYRTAIDAVTEAVAELDKYRKLYADLVQAKIRPDAKPSESAEKWAERIIRWNDLFSTESIWSRSGMNCGNLHLAGAGSVIAQMAVAEWLTAFAAEQNRELVAERDELRAKLERITKCLELYNKATTNPVAHRAIAEAMKEVGL